jgi:hypothetical protein
VNYIGVHAPAGIETAWRQFNLMFETYLNEAVSRRFVPPIEFKMKLPSNLSKIGLTPKKTSLSCMRIQGCLLAWGQRSGDSYLVLPLLIFLLVADLKDKVIED